MGATCTPAPRFHPTPTAIRSRVSAIALRARRPVEFPNYQNAMATQRRRAALEQVRLGRPIHIVQEIDQKDRIGGAECDLARVAVLDGGSRVSRPAMSGRPRPFARPIRPRGCARPENARRRGPPSGPCPHRGRGHRGSPGFAKGRTGTPGRTWSSTSRSA